MSGLYHRGAPTSRQKEKTDRNRTSCPGPIHSIGFPFPVLRPALAFRPEKLYDTGADFLPQKVRRPAYRFEERKEFMMKRWIGIILAVMLLVTLASAAFAEDGGGRTMWVRTQNGKGLLVRTSPSARDDSNVVGVLPYGAEVVCYGRNESGWAVIEYGGHYDHYVMYRFLSNTKPGPYQKSEASAAGETAGSTKNASTVAQMNKLVSPAKFVTPYEVTVRPTRASGWVYMRWFPSKSAEAVATFGANYRLTVIAELKDWYQVQDPATGKVGFVYKSYVQ